MFTETMHISRSAKRTAYASSIPVPPDEQPSHTQQKQRPSPTLPHRRIDWHHPGVGYLSVLPILALTVLLTLAMRSIVTHFRINNTFLMLATSLVALSEEMGPTILMLILGIIFLDFLVIPSPWIDELDELAGHYPEFPFSLGGLLVAALTARHQRAANALRQRTQELKEFNVSLCEHPEELEGLNISLHAAANQAKDQPVAVTTQVLQNPPTLFQFYTQWFQRIRVCPHKRTPSALTS